MLAMKMIRLRWQQEKNSEISEKLLASRVKRRRSDLVVIRVLVKVSRVSWGANLGNNGSRHRSSD
jgi:hypothetical protein